MTMARRVLAAVLLGLVAGSAVVLAETVLRLLAGVSLPSELGGDRFLPLLPVSTFLDLLGRLGGPIRAKELAFWGGFAGVLATGVAAAIAWEVLRRGRRGRRAAGLAAVAFLAGVMAVLWPVLGSSYVGLPPTTAAVVTALALTGQVGLAAVLVHRLRPPSAPVTDTARRSVLMGAAGLVMLGLTGGLAGRLNADSSFGYDGTRLVPGAGGRQPITPVKDFYVVTKNLIDPDVDPALWSLEVGGAVARPYSIGLAELRATQSRSQETTLECVSNGVGFGLLSNAMWTGPTLRTLLERAGPSSSARMVELRGADGYVYPLALDTALREEVVVAHAMNGEPLSRRHGAPARAVIPGAYGEASAKWLTRVTVLEQDEEGYYGSQGWVADHVHTTSVIDQPLPGATLPAGAAAMLRGVAFAGDRGIDRVEVSTDGGASWAPARIEYAGPATAWSLWSLLWTPTATGTAVLTVRAYDRTGAVQESTPHGFAPGGASGLHRVEVRVV